MATKTLRVQLADLIGPAGPSGRVHSAEVWVEPVDGNGAPRTIRYTDGSVVIPARVRKPLDGAGVADFVLVPSDDSTVHADDRGFGVRVGYKGKVRGDGGGWVDVSSPGKVIQIVSADPSTVMFGSKADYVPVIPGSTYLTTAAGDARLCRSRPLGTAAASGATRLRHRRTLRDLPRRHAGGCSTRHRYGAAADVAPPRPYRRQRPPLLPIDSTGQTSATDVPSGRTSFMVGTPTRRASRFYAARGTIKFSLDYADDHGIQPSSALTTRDLTVDLYRRAPPTLARRACRRHLGSPGGTVDPTATASTVIHGQCPPCVGTGIEAPAHPTTRTLLGTSPTAKPADWSSLSPVRVKRYGLRPRPESRTTTPPRYTNLRGPLSRYRPPGNRRGGTSPRRAARQLHATVQLTHSWSTPRTDCDLATSFSAGGGSPDRAARPHRRATAQQHPARRRRRPTRLLPTTPQARHTRLISANVCRRERLHGIDRARH